MSSSSGARRNPPPAPTIVPRVPTTNPIGTNHQKFTVRPSGVYGRPLRAAPTNHSRDFRAATGAAPTNHSRDFRAATGAAPTKHSRDFRAATGAAPTSHSRDFRAATGAAPASDVDFGLSRTSMEVKPGDLTAGG